MNSPSLLLSFSPLVPLSPFLPLVPLSLFPLSPLSPVLLSSFQERVKEVQGASLFLEAVGFQQKLLPHQGDSYSPLLLTFLSTLSLPPPPPPPPPLPISPSPSPTDSEQQFYVLPEEKAKDMEHLQVCRELLSSSSPLRATLDRNLTLFRPSVRVTHFDLPGTCTGGEFSHSLTPLICVHLSPSLMQSPSLLPPSLPPSLSSSLSPSLPLPLPSSLPPQLTFSICHWMKFEGSRNKERTLLKKSKFYGRERCGNVMI